MENKGYINSLTGMYRYVKVKESQIKKTILTMTLPTILLGLIIALLYGTLYHLIRGGSFWRLLLYLGLSVLGFVAGHIIGLWRGWTLIPLGSLNFGLSSIGSMVILILGDWLGHLEAG